MKRSLLHLRAVMDDMGAGWHSLPPHEPTRECAGNQPCPPGPDDPCSHVHRTSSAALDCSRSREPWS